MKSLNQQVQIISGLIDTHDVSDWENKFLKSIRERTDHGKDTSKLSEKQIEVIERIYSKHFAGGALADFMAIVCICFVVFFVLGLAAYGIYKQKDCNERGGLYLRTPSGYACVKVVKLP